MSKELAKQTNISQQVMLRVNSYRDSGELHFPLNYSPENALKQAWLVLQETQDRNKKPALAVCTPNSVANSLFSMVIQGLSPDKKQCYFIVYGNQLTLQRSYFGSMAVAKRSNPDISEIYSDVVYSADEFSYYKKRGRTVVDKHVQKLENIDKTKIIAAYATVVFKDNTEYSEIMTLDQIKQSWQMSKVRPVDDKGNISAGSTHGKFTEEMAKKTVVNRLCKNLINSSDDSSLVIKHFEQDNARAEVEEIITEEANTIIIDDYVVNEQTGEVQEETTAAEVIETVVEADDTPQF